MDGMTLLHEARAAGLEVAVDHGRLVVRGPKRAEDLARRLLAHKREILSALAVETLPEAPPDVSPWDLPPDWFERWEERTCIMHYDGKLHWERAEALALADILRQMRAAGISISHS